MSSHGLNRAIVSTRCVSLEMCTSVRYLEPQEAYFMVAT